MRPDALPDGRDGWRESVPPLLAEIADASAQTLREVAGMESAQADYLGYQIMRAIAQHVGGAQVYIPKADSIARCARDEAIWRDFRGHNTRELSRRYGVTEIHVYRIVKRMREAERARRQDRLQLDDDAAATDCNFRNRR